MLVYMMQALSLPIVVYNDINNVCREFLWGITTIRGKFTLLTGKIWSLQVGYVLRKLGTSNCDSAH